MEFGVIDFEFQLFVLSRFALISIDRSLLHFLNSLFFTFFPFFYIGGIVKTQTDIASGRHAQPTGRQSRQLFRSRRFGRLVLDCFSASDTGLS